MSQPFIFINTYTIKPGMVDAYLRKHQEVVDLVEAKEPKMLYFGCHVSEDRSEATTVQVHADADNMAFHMQVAGEHIRLASEYLDWSSMRIRIYGSPGEDLLAQMRELAGSGVSVTISPLACGFDRFAELTP